MRSIYSSPSLSFTVTNTVGYRARAFPTARYSHHSFGAAIDINWTVNDLYMGKDKRNPKSPYYIPQSVIDIFAEHGWAWGGNFKECCDTMHFQYLGLDLTAFYIAFPVFFTVGDPGYSRFDNVLFPAFRHRIKGFQSVLH